MFVLELHYGFINKTKTELVWGKAADIMVKVSLSYLTMTYKNTIINYNYILCITRIKTI